MTLTSPEETMSEATAPASRTPAAPRPDLLPLAVPRSLRNGVKRATGTNRAARAGDRENTGTACATTDGAARARRSASLTVSVVVPTYRRPDLLDRCLAALLAQTLSPQRYEILVADDAACAETRAQVERWSAVASVLDRGILYLVVNGAHGPAAARNAGWRAASGDVIAFTDDDCVPAPGWLRAGLAALEADDTIAGISGTLIVPLDGLPTDYERDAARLASAEFVTANCFYRRDALEHTGGFDERFPVAWREDTDLQYRMLALGARLVKARDAVVVHPLRPARWGVSIGQQRKSMYNALLYKKHPRLYRERIQRRPPLRYYTIVGLLLAAGASAVQGWRGVAALAALLWLALTVDFCRRRLRDTSRQPRHIAEMAVTSAVIPPLSVYWRLRGALKYRVWFL